MKYIILGLLFFSSPSFCSSIHDTARTGNVDLLEKLLNTHPELLEMTDNNQHTPFLAAVAGLQPNAVKLLLNKGANTQVCNKLGNAFHILAFCGSNELSTNATQETYDSITTIGRLLMNARVSLTQRNSRGHKAFSTIARTRCYPLFSLLQAQNTDMFVCFHQVVTWITKKPNLIEKAIKALLALGIRPHEWYNTYLHHEGTLIDAALLNDRIESVRLLLAANMLISDAGLGNIINKYVCEREGYRPVYQEDFPEGTAKDVLITTLACSQLHGRAYFQDVFSMPHPRTYTATQITEQITPEDLEKLQPEVDDKKMELLTDPGLKQFLLPRKQIEAQRRGLSLERYLQYTKR